MWLSAHVEESSHRRATSLLCNVSSALNLSQNGNAPGVREQLRFYSGEVVNALHMKLVLHSLEWQ
jgi:hypothetical protein